MSKQVICDYCGNSNEPKALIAPQKSFGGRKLHDVLQIVTHQDLPANLALKVCFLCASTLMSTMGVIDKTQKLVENAKGAAAAKNKKPAIQTDEPDKSVVNHTAEAEAKSAKPSTPLAKNVTLRQRSKSMAARTSDLIFPRSPKISVNETDELNASPSKKTPKKNTSRLDDSLDDSVRLTPAKKVAASKKAFVQLFGSRNGDATPDSEEEEEDDNAADEHADKVIAIKKGFDCKLCDFQARAAKAFKEHLFKEHGQQRPRIYFCDLCPKSFGILKSWRIHIENVHGVTVEAPQKEAKAKVAKAKEQQQTKDCKEDEVKPIEKSPRKEKSNKATKEQPTNDEGKPLEKSPRKEKSNKASKEQQTNNEVKPLEKSPRKEKSNKASKEQQTKDSINDELNPTIEKSPQKEKSNKTNEKNEAQEEINESSHWPQLATIKALNGEEVAKKKWLDKVINNPDYTFDVNGSSASTPKAADFSIELSNEYKCDICDSEFTVAKQMQEHMKVAHGIDKPKVFKCPVCDKGLTTKQTLKHHMNLHNEGCAADDKKSSKRKILHEEQQDVDIAEKSTAEEDDQMPEEEKILHSEDEIEEMDTTFADESVIMAPPKINGKKPKKTKSPDTLAAVSDSPSKNSKRKSPKDEPIITVDLMEEVNINVKPHKKARLQSVSDSFSSSFDDYSTAEEPLLSCSQCGKQVKSKQRLALHIRKRHGTKLECPGCKTSYTNQRDYVNHFAVCSSGGSLLPCGVENCKKSFYEANYLSSHLNLKHQWA